MQFIKHGVENLAEVDVTSLTKIVKVLACRNNGHWNKHVEYDSVPIIIKHMIKILITDPTRRTCFGSFTFTIIS